MILSIIFLTALLPVSFLQILSPAVTISVVPDYENNIFNLTCHLEHVKLASIKDDHNLISYYLIPENDQSNIIKLASWNTPAAPDVLQKNTKAADPEFKTDIQIPTLGIETISAGESKHPNYEAKFKLIENDNNSTGTYFCQLNFQTNDPNLSKYYYSRLWSTKLAVPSSSALLTTSPSKADKIDSPFIATCWIGSFDQNDIISKYTVNYYSDEKLIGNYDISFVKNDITSKFTVAENVPSEIRVIGTAAIFPRFDAVIKFESTVTNSSLQCSVKVDDGEDQKSNIYTHEIEEKEEPPTGKSFPLMPSIIGITLTFIVLKFTV